MKRSILLGLLLVWGVVFSSFAARSLVGTTYDLAAKSVPVGLGMSGVNANYGVVIFADSDSKNAVFRDNRTGVYYHGYVSHKDNWVVTQRLGKTPVLPSSYYVYYCRGGACKKVSSYGVAKK